MTAWRRHAAAMALLAALMALFTINRAGLPAVHLWNRALADAAFVLLCLILCLGPLARLAPRLPSFLAWRRELGLWCALAAAAHVTVYAAGALGWNWLGFFSEQTHHLGLSLLKNAYAVANWLGAAALVLLAVLALTSNDWSQRALRWSGWKFLQQQTYTAFALTLLHAGAFLYAIIQSGHGVFPTAYWGGGLAALILQVAGFVWTVRRQRARPSNPP
jgi:sulfoxide reductase heme-binding subunit YedZ